MLALAALNRWRLTSRLAAQGARTGAGGSSLLAETGLGLLVLALVAALGLLPPAAA
jgi:putative copper export protein